MKMKNWVKFIILIFALPATASSINKTNTVIKQNTPNNKTQTNYYSQADKNILNWVDSENFKGDSQPVVKPVPSKTIPDKDAVKNAKILQELDRKDSLNLDEMDIKTNNKRGYFIKPSELFGKNFDVNIHDSDFLLKLSNLLNIEENFLDYQAIGKVITSTKGLISNDNHNGKLRVVLSIYEFLAGDLMGSSLEAKRAIASMSMGYLPHLILGLIFDTTNEHDLAVSQIKQAIAQEPKQAILHEYLGTSYLNANDISQSINEFRRSIGLKPSVRALAYLSQALLIANDKTGALKAARIAESISHGSALAQIALSRALLANDEKQSALRVARQAILLDPMLAQSHIVLGRALSANGQSKEAMLELKEAVNLEPLSAQARNDYGYLLYKQNDLLPAIDEFRLALRLNPNLAEARNNLEIAIYGFSQVKSNKLSNPLKFISK